RASASSRAGGSIARTRLSKIRNVDVRLGVAEEAAAHADGREQVLDVVTEVEAEGLRCRAADDAADRALEAGKRDILRGGRFAVEGVGNRGRKAMRAGADERLKKDVRAADDGQPAADGAGERGRTEVLPTEATGSAVTDDVAERVAERISQRAQAGAGK